MRLPQFVIAGVAVLVFALIFYGFWVSYQLGAQDAYISMILAERENKSQLENYHRVKKSFSPPIPGLQISKGE